MFKKNKKENEVQLMIPLFTNIEVDNFLDRIHGTEEESFYHEIFKNIDETIFEPLYHQKTGRPNAPVNAILASLILRVRKGWSYAELIKQLKFNIAARYAVGIFDFSEIPFNEQTIFNFLNRVKSHKEKTKNDLFSEMFDSLVKKQVKKMNVKTDILRTDSIMLNSNIKKYGRIQLLLEIILRLYKQFSDEDKQIFNENFSKYTEKSSEKFLYEINPSDLSHELTAIGSIYFWLNSNLKDSYKKGKDFDNFMRVLEEHFILENDKIEVKEASEIESKTLQSPDDSDATFRKKNGNEYRGFTGTITETCNPENDVNLIVDVKAEQNNVDDSKILNKQFANILDKTGAKEIHVDGAYGSSLNDKFCNEHEIMMIQTAIRGRKSKVSLRITKKDNIYEVSCPNKQTVKAVKTKHRYKACFDLNICKKCPFANECGTQKQQNSRVFYFSNDDFDRNARLRNIEEIPEKRRTLRNNVEATMNEISCKLNNHKLRTRGQYKASEYLIMSTIGINFGRIFRFFNFELFFTDIFKILIFKRKIFSNCEFSYE